MLPIPMSSSNKSILSAEGLSAIFPNQDGGLHALDDINFTVPFQQFVCVLGPSGSGKSTLLRIFGGLLKPTRGKAFYEGSLITNPSSRIGLVFQDSNLMPWRTVIENITLPLEIQKIPPEESSQLAGEMIRLVGLEGFENWMPADLSGGMAQRVSIARALVYNPDILLLDEPFGALDALTREKMALELLRIWQVSNKTVIMVTHSITEAILLADRIIVLTSRPGKICLDMAIELKRPRSEEIRYSDEFISIEQRLREAISTE